MIVLPGRVLLWALVALPATVLPVLASPRAGRGAPAVGIGVSAITALVARVMAAAAAVLGVNAGWCHGDRQRSALRFFLYAFPGSLALLAGFIGRYLASSPHTFGRVRLASENNFAGRGTLSVVARGAIVLGPALKTPTVPSRTCLPPAPTDAPCHRHRLGARRGHDRAGPDHHQANDRLHVDQPHGPHRPRRRRRRDRLAGHRAGPFGGATGP